MKRSRRRETVARLRLKRGKVHKARRMDASTPRADGPACVPTLKCPARDILFAFVFLVAAGCGSKGLEGIIPIRGDVTHKGKPLRSGEVRYLPVDPEGRVARGLIQSDGSFRLTTVEMNDGALPGEYRIAVVVYPDETQDQQHSRRTQEIGRRSGGAPAPLVPQKYYSGHTSGLTDTVDDGHSGYKELTLTD